MRPGYETLDHHSPRNPYPYRHTSEMRRPQIITERLANGGIRQTVVDAADLESGRERAGEEMQISARLRRALNSGDPAVALRARKLQLLMLST